MVRRPQFALGGAEAGSTSAPDRTTCERWIRLMLVGIKYMLEVTDMASGT